MINYHRSAFGWNLLFRVHGSAVYRACLPGLIALIIFFMFRYFCVDCNQYENTIEHPYVIGVVVGGITFLIVFRASSSYARYWEATTCIYGMQSKWMDATISTAGYHMQCSHYDKIKPPSYFTYPQLNAEFLTRDRERLRQEVSFRAQQGVMNSQRAIMRSINAVADSDSEHELGDDVDLSQEKHRKSRNPHDQSTLRSQARAHSLITDMIPQKIKDKLPRGSGHAHHGHHGSGHQHGSGGHHHSSGRSKYKQQASNLFETANAVQERRTQTGVISFALRNSLNGGPDGATTVAAATSDTNNINGDNDSNNKDDSMNSDGLADYIVRLTDQVASEHERNETRDDGDAAAKTTNHVSFGEDDKEQPEDISKNANFNKVRPRLVPTSKLSSSARRTSSDESGGSTSTPPGGSSARRLSSKRKRSSKRTARGPGGYDLEHHRRPAVEQPHFLSGPGRLDGNWGPLFDDGKDTFVDPHSKSNKPPVTGFASFQGGRTPPLFLQELAHLSSLLTAVAFSTLRNDIDGTESPLDFYHIGSPWPEVDPGDIEDLNAGIWTRISRNLCYFFGGGRTPEERTRYNAARPLSVLGGVSDNEIKFLQMARGPYAKTQLCWNWISEFITREHLEGSLGQVGAPIISRVVQFLGDGMREYNHARKIMFIPFPFPHAQLSAVYVLVMVPMIPYLMHHYTTLIWVGATLTFLTVTCLSAIHEVARELENPFRNIPNELPVCTLMAEYNETLLTMYSGFHPDFFWEVPDELLVSMSTHTKSNSSVGSLNFDPGVASYTNTDAKLPKQEKDVLEDSIDSFGYDYCNNHDDTGGASSTDEKFENSMSSLLNTVLEEDQDHDEASEEIIFSHKEADDDGKCISNNQKIKMGENKMKHLLNSGCARSVDTDDGQNNDDVDAGSPITTETTASNVSTSTSGSSTVGHSNTRNSNDAEVEQLQFIVLQQGKMMTNMLEEQARLNKMIESLLTREQKKNQ